MALNDQIRTIIESIVAKDELPSSNGQLSKSLEFFKTCSTNSISDFESQADELGISDTVRLQIIASLLNIPWRESIAGLIPSLEFVKLYPFNLAQKFQILGLSADDGVLPLAVGSMEGLEQVDIVTRHLKMEVEPFFADPSQIRSVITAAFQQRDSQTFATIASLDRDEIINELRESGDREDLLDNSTRSPVVRLVNSVLFDAVQERASDIHIQPYEDRLQIRFRIDGVLFDQFEVPKSNQEEILSRVKILGKMNIAEKRLPQDGRSSVQIADRLIDLRIASLPTSCGERIVIRLLDKSARLYTLRELGMANEVLTLFDKMIHQEHGLILVTGPTGSGKSTTLYAALQEINSKQSNVVTLEDPIEYQLDGISQTQINEKKGMTFAKGLRNILRQDPDIIMVGEIRDQETAEMAIQSALTGHLVFSTLHTNDAASAITRLLDLGVEPYLLSSSLLGVIAQRLVRRNCPECKKQTTELDAARQLGIAEDQLASIYQGDGCSECRDTGYFGRVGLFEQMVVTESVKSLIQQQANASQIRTSALGEGMQLLKEDGIQKMLLGETTIEEVIRVSTFQD